MREQERSLRSRDWGAGARGLIALGLSSARVRRAQSPLAAPPTRATPPPSGPGGESFNRHVLTGDRSTGLGRRLVGAKVRAPGGPPASRGLEEAVSVRKPPQSQGLGPSSQGGPPPQTLPRLADRGRGSRGFRGVWVVQSSRPLSLVAPAAPAVPGHREGTGFTGGEGRKGVFSGPPDEPRAWLGASRSRGASGKEGRARVLCFGVRASSPRRLGVSTLNVSLRTRRRRGTATHPSPPFTLFAAARARTPATGRSLQALTLPVWRGS